MWVHNVAIRPVSPQHASAAAGSYGQRVRTRRHLPVPANEPTRRLACEEGLAFALKYGQDVGGTVLKLLNRRCRDVVLVVPAVEGTAGRFLGIFPFLV